MLDAIGADLPVALVAPETKLAHALWRFAPGVLRRLAKLDVIPVVRTSLKLRGGVRRALTKRTVMLLKNRVPGSNTGLSNRPKDSSTCDPNGSRSSAGWSPTKSSTCSSAGWRRRCAVTPRPPSPSQSSRPRTGGTSSGWRERSRASTRVCGRDDRGRGSRSGADQADGRKARRGHALDAAVRHPRPRCRGWDPGCGGRLRPPELSGAALRSGPFRARARTERRGGIARGHRALRPPPSNRVPPEIRITRQPQAPPGSPSDVSEPDAAPSRIPPSR